MRTCVYWLIGRGASIACNLTWTVPGAWHGLDREVKIARIKQAIASEMDSPTIDVTPYAKLLEKLSGHTINPWRHLFITTNWDYLLQREILKLNLTVLPQWLANSHVFHINGTVENLEDNSRRSPFLLEDDPPDKRVSTLEADRAFAEMIWGRLFVVIGMSFECQMDKFLLTNLNRVQDDLPIGESKWIIVNSNGPDLEQSAERIQKALPGGTIIRLKKPFKLWIDENMPQLQHEGVLAF